MLIECERWSEAGSAAAISRGVVEDSSRELRSNESKSDKACLPNQREQQIGRTCYCAAARRPDRDRASTPDTSRDACEGRQTVVNGDPHRLNRSACRSTLLCSVFECLDAQEQPLFQC